MKFGPVALTEAKGAVLAHSVALGAGRLRKGRVLDDADLTALQQAGYSKVTVARLDALDLDEDSAAIALAQALVPDPQAAGLSLAAVGTGRVNIVAQGSGLVQLNPAQVHGVNSVDPAITVATLPDQMRVEAGAMVATVKIISYGVAASAVEKACVIGRSGLRLAPPVLRRASLIQTWVRPDDDGTKGHAVTAARLGRLGVALDPICIVPHQIDPLADALLQAQGELVLILTGSATSDLHDTAPEALRKASGEVVHFGMPVDPGNLLFLGHLGGRPVIGLPGCAKSPALNGADWVMERIICGQAVTATDIMAMGVGGLLKEIPTRPRPRRAGEKITGKGQGD